MAIISGKEGNVKWDASIAPQDFTKIQSWTVSNTVDVVKQTGMQDTWDTFLTGQVDWTATVEALLDSAGLDIGLAIGNPNGLGDVPAALELYIDFNSTGGPLYVALNGFAICNGITINSEKDGVTSVTYAFQGSGILAYHSGAAVPTY